MKNIWLLATALALAPLMAMAAGPGAVRKQIESSMLVEGTIEITAEGTVRSLGIERQEKLPEDLVAFVQQQVALWTFEPVLVDGTATPARSRMALRLVARRLDDTRMTVGIRSASFNGEAPEPGAAVDAISMKPPRYPSQAVRSGVAGTVYLVLKIGREGRVEDVVVEQVNLRVVASDKEMTRYRALLADATLKAAREWTFQAPIIGELADDEFWSVRVPTDYTFDRSRGDGYGQWQAYVPGPRETVPWKTDEDPAFSPDALADGGVYTAGAAQGPRLLTPLDGG